MQGARIIEIPACKMVSSGKGTFGEERFDRFDAWFSSFPRSIYPKDFLYSVEGGFCWLYLYEEGMAVPEPFEIIDFSGGLYCVTTDVDGHTDWDRMNRDTDAFLAENGFERDFSRVQMGNVITPPTAQEILGYGQMDYYTPIKPKDAR